MAAGWLEYYDTPFGFLIPKTFLNHEIKTCPSYIRPNFAIHLSQITIRKIIMTLAGLGLLASCQNPDGNEAAAEENTADTASTEMVQEETPAVDVDAVVLEIEALREKVEANLDSLERKELSLENARAQIKQKWAKMDAYLMDGEVVRIKMYPHEGVSERT
jgi:hypothetical protein